MADQLDNTIHKNAAGPKWASGDPGSVEQHALAEVAEWNGILVVIAYLVSRLQIYYTQEALRNLQQTSQSSSSTVSDVEGFVTNPERHGVGR